MNKKWEEELLKLKAINYNLWIGSGKDACDNCVDFEEAVKELNAFVDKHLSRAVAKERTQLLVRVREEVIGYAEESYISVPGDIRDKLRKEQLKKLEIISEEGK